MKEFFLKITICFLFIGEALCSGAQRTSLSRERSDVQVLPSERKPEVLPYNEELPMGKRANFVLSEPLSPLTEDEIENLKKAKEFVAADSSVSEAKKISLLAQKDFLTNTKDRSLLQKYVLARRQYLEIERRAIVARLPELKILVDKERQIAYAKWHHHLARIRYLLTHDIPLTPENFRETLEMDFDSVYDKK